MGRLPEIQTDFQSYLLNGDTAIGVHVVGTERVPIETRLAIYGDGYRARLAEALQANFPVLAELLGEGDFETLAAAYIRTHDSPFFSIRYYGNALSEFLATESEYAGAPVLAELARWEWAMTEVFDAPDAESIAVADLAHVAPEDWAELRFEWHPSVRRLALSWNAPQIWKAVSDGSSPSGTNGSRDDAPEVDASRSEVAAPRDADQPNVVQPDAARSETVPLGAARPDVAPSDLPEVAYNPEPVEWLLWRHELRTFFRSLQPGETAALTAAREGQSFGEICALLSAEFGETEAPAKAAGFLRNWVESGLLTAVR